MLRHAERECWLQCTSHQGYCGYCGAGACCKRFFLDAPAECALGAIGCVEHHCCVLPPRLPANRSAFARSRRSMQSPPPLPSSGSLLPSAVTAPLPPSQPPHRNALPTAPMPAVITLTLRPEAMAAVVIGVVTGCLLIIATSVAFACWCWKRHHANELMLAGLSNEIRSLKVVQRRGLLSTSQPPSPSLSPTQSTLSPYVRAATRAEQEALSHMAEALAREEVALSREEAAMLAAEEAEIAAEEASLERLHSEHEARAAAAVAVACRRSSRVSSNHQPLLGSPSPSQGSPSTLSAGAQWMAPAVQVPSRALEAEAKASSVRTDRSRWRTMADTGAVRAQLESLVRGDILARQSATDVPTIQTKIYR